MGFYVPAISCMLSLPSDTSLFYLKMINGVAVNVHEASAAPLHHWNELCGVPSATCDGTLNSLKNDPEEHLHYAAGRTLCSGTSGCLWRVEGGGQHEIILYPTGQQHAYS